MENKDVPYIVYEGEQVRHERREKRKDIIIMVLVVFIFLSNLAWLFFFNQFDVVSDVISQDTAGGNNSYVGSDGVINNGATDCD